MPTASTSCRWACWDRAGHGAAAGNVGAAGAQRSSRSNAAQNLGGDEPASHPAVRRRVSGHSRHDHARDVAHGAFDAQAAALGLALAAYGVGLPAMALVRIVAPLSMRGTTRHAGARHADRDGRNIAMKLVFVWGLHLGSPAWRWARRWAPGSISFCWSALGRRLGLAIDAAFRRAVPPDPAGGGFCWCRRLIGARAVGCSTAQVCRTSRSTRSGAMSSHAAYVGVVLAVPPLRAAAWPFRS